MESCRCTVQESLPRDLCGFEIDSFLKEALQNPRHRLTDEWWKNFGIDDLELQTLAIRILSQTCSSSGCERNWSVFERIHTKRRNRLEHKRLNDLVYSHYNLRLKERQASRKSLTDPISLENIDLTDDWVVEAEDDDAPLLDVDEIDDWMDVADAILDEGEGGAAAVLRMELDIQKFMQNPEQHQFEFQHFPTSYLRLAAHRVAQHYGLQSMALDSVPDGSGNRIIVRKTFESRYPNICLFDIPMKMPESDRSEHVKIAIRPRPNMASPNDPTGVGVNRSLTRTVEERKEEYDRARARIFSSSSGNSDLEVESSSGDESEHYRNAIEELEKIGAKDSNCRVAIFRDREKDRSDPDYDRSYDRYFRGPTPNQNFNLGPFNLQSFQAPFVQYETGFPQLGQLPRIQNSMNYRPSNPVLNPFCAAGLNQTSRDAVYMHWPSPAMMYAHSYDHFRQAVIQTPFYQQPLSFDHGQHY